MRGVLRYFEIVFLLSLVILIILGIGYILWPITSDKITSLRSGEWSSRSTTSDHLQQRFEDQLQNITNSTTAA